MAPPENIWKNIRQLMNRKNLYALLVGATLSYFTINRSLIGMSESRIYAYSLLYLMSLVPIYASKEQIVTNEKGLFKWEGKKKYGVLSMSASWSVGLFAGLAGMLLVAGMQAREAIIMPSEAILDNLAQQALIVAPVETIVFVVIAPQYLASAFGKGRWGMILTFIISQAAFSLWHVTAYGGDVWNLLIAFGSGIAFLAIAVQSGGPEMSQGLHTGVNIVNTGIITLTAASISIVNLIGLG